MKLVLTAAVSGLLGLGLGWLAFHAEPVVSHVETRVPQVIERAGAEQVRVVEGPSRTVVPAAPGAGSGSAPSVNAPTAANTTAAEVAALQQRVAQLEASLESKLKARRMTEGAPVEVPAGLPPRFRDEQQLVSTFNAALEEAGFPGQVSNVDCSEHPCIVFGSGFGDRDDMAKLLPTSAMTAYAKDSMSTFGFMRGPDRDPANRFFGVAVMPADGEPSEELRKRIAFRVRQMEEVSRPPAKP